MKDFKSKAAAYLRKHAVKGRLRSGISILSCIVVFTSTYALVLPALTLESRAACGMEEHQHTEECYDDVLICGQEESEGHTHTEECYNDAGELICGQEESEGHTHTEDCYEKQLTCGKEVHIHTEACYPDEEEEQADSDSTKEQSDDAKASDSGQNDSDNDGQDAASAENKEQSQTDQETTGEGAAEQTASEQTPSTQEDGKQEDMPAGAADPESLDRIKFVDYLTDETTVLYVPEDGDKWQPIHKDDEADPEEDVKLTPDQKILLHIGYELPAGTINETNAETEYTLPLLMNLSDDEVEENNEKYYNMIEGTDREADNLESAGRYEIREKKNDDGEVIERKLVLTFDSDACKKNGGEKLTDGTETLAAQKLEGFFEILISAQDLVDPEAETALEKERVDLAPIQLEDGQTKENYLYSYLIEWNEDKEELDTEVFYDGPALDAWLADQKGEKEEDSVFAAGTLEFEGEDYKVAATFDESAQLPEGVTLQVSELKGEEYDAYLEQAQSALGEEKTVAGARFFDITFVNADGEPVEPKGMVDVRIEYERAETIEDSANVEGLHFTEEGAQAIEMENNGQTPGENGEPALDSVSFSSDSFSVYGVVYTVDFHWEVDGKTYDFSIPGGGFVSFEHLAEVLNLAASEIDDETAGSLADTANGPEEAASIADEAIRLNEVAVSDRTKQFTACVQDIEFSNPLLADVCKVDTDTTVGQIKADRALEVEYSADLTKEQIDAINAQVIEGGDWVLISEHPFDTEETLTVTMKTGEVFVIKVTDSNFASTVDGKTFALIIANNAKTRGYALDVNVRGDGRFTSRQTNINYLGETVNEEVYFCDNVNSIKWTFEYIKGSGNQFKLKANNGQYLHYENGRFSLSNEPTILYADVTPGDNDHVRLCLDEGLHNAINLYGGNNGFGIWGNGSNDPNETFTLCKPFDMSTNTPGTITTVDNNAEGIELKLFDYDYIATPGTTGDLDKEGNRIYGDDLGSSYNISVNTGKKFWFLGWGSSSNETDPGINDFTGLGDNIRALQGIVKNNLVGGYPELAVDQNGNATNDSLAYLFDGTANDTKSYTANHLFEKIGDKYSYDSNKHYAEFNKTTGNFTVYDGTLEQNSGADKQYAKNDKAVGFFPFDSYSDMKGLYDNNRLYLNPNISENDQRKSNGQHYRMNHHNGMSLDAHFRMPEAGKDSYGNDIEFEFSGDDDLWVYIDDVLVLDIGGVHQPLNGKINFTTGEVTVDAAVEADGVSSSAIAGASTTIEEMFRKAGKTYDPHKLHEMKVFWIERGGCDSNCKIEFNLPLTTTKEAGAVTFDKVSALNQSLKLEGAVFTLYTDPACTTPLLIGNVPVTATSGENGVVNFYAIPTGDYYVKETTFPEGYAAKDPEEIFTVHVAKDTTSRPLINGAEVNPVTNEPKKISVDVEKVWENGMIPDGAAIEIVLGRYRLVEDPNAQGKGTLVIKDSYTGLPTGSNYNVTYTITGPDNYSNTIRKSYADTSKDIEISVPNLPAGVQYTVTKTVAGISHYNTNNGSGTQTAIVPKKGSVDVRFSQSTFTRNAYKVTIYSLDKKVNVNTWVAAKYYPANSSLYLRGSYKNDNWARGRRFQYSFDNSSFKDFQIENNGQWNQTGRTEQFILNQDIDIYIRTQESDNDANSWTKDYDWFVNPTINGANPVSTNSAGRMMMASPARAAANVLSQTAQAPTLPVPPKDTVYELDAEYAADPGKITLSGNTWTGSIGDLYADNEYGPYVYYIAQVNETGMPEGTQITISDEVSLDGDAKVLTVTNNVPTGDLQITKNILKNGTTDASATGTFYYAIFDEEYNPDANPAQTPVRTGSIEVTQGGTKTVTESGLYYGTYYVYELTAQNGTPIISGADGVDQVIGNVKYIVTGSGTSTSVSGTDGTVNLTNNHEIGFLKIKKVVKFDGHDPTNATVPGTNPAQSEKQILAGEYKFKIFSDESLMTQVGALTITVLNDGQVVYSNPIELPVGQYWIEEEAVVGKPIYPIEDNPRSVTITTQNTSELAKEFEVTNDYYVNSDEDTYTIDIEKRFEGLTEDEIPSNFQMVLQYQMEGVETPREIILHKNLRGIQQDGIVATFEKDSTGTNWVWHLMDIPSKASGFQIKEENYNKLGLACNTFRLNRTETSSTEQQIENPDQYMAVNMTGPDNVGFYEVTSEKRYTPDNNTSFWIDEGTVLLVSLTGSHAGTAVISLTALNNIEREAIRHSIPLSEGSFAQPVYFYSIEQHPNSITPNNNRRITVGEVNGRKYVTMKKSGSSMEGVFEVTYYGESTFNNEIIINKYSENTEIDIVKVTNDTLDQETKTPLEDAVFQITQLNEQSTASHVFYLTKTEGGTQVPVYQRTTDPTDSDGKASFTGLSSGYYEIKEIASPGGYILLGDVIYVHINHGTVTYLKKPETETDPDKPIAEWESITSGVNVRFEAAQEATQTTEASNATFTIGNEPGAALPSTGGPGTWAYRILGSILILGAGVLLWRRRRTI